MEIEESTFEERERKMYAASIKAKANVSEEKNYFPTCQAKEKEKKSC